MLMLMCPYCGVMADETELTPGGEAHLRRQGPASSDQDFSTYLFDRKNPKGVHVERWVHRYGCGKWFHAVRCTQTLAVFGTYSAQTYRPPAEICQFVVQRHPDWQWVNSEAEHPTSLDHTSEDET